MKRLGMRNFMTLLGLFFCMMSQVDATGEAVPWALLRRILPNDPIVLEAGANNGADTQWMSEFWSQGKIYAFEPLPEAFQHLQKVATKRKNVTIFPFALSNQKGKFPFYVAGGASSLLCPTESFNRDYFHCNTDCPIYVDTITLDEWCQLNSVEKIDFMWLDLEGNELNTLAGALKILDTVKLIYVEVNFQKFWKDCVMYEDLKQWLESKGFQEIWKDIVPHWHGNVLFLKN